MKRKKLFKNCGLPHSQHRIVSTWDKPSFEPGCDICDDMLLHCRKSGILGYARFRM